MEIIGKSEAMAKVIDHLDKVVDTRVTVLIEGETGTGKELIAAAVHYRSRRRDKLFVAQNCAALAESLLESELFGHKKGSFTGATDEKKGLFEIADGGTLFLDEITETPMSLQASSCAPCRRARSGPSAPPRSKHVNVRIVAATNRNLEDEVKAGRFREDLYYRLKVFPLRLPPLRERREDIPLLAAHFLARYAAEIGKPVGGFSQQAIELMLSYDWPGNVRELQNEVQRLVIQLEPGAFATPELLSPRIRQVEGLVLRAGVGRGHAQGHDGLGREVLPHRGAARARQQQDERGQGPRHHPRGAAQEAAALRDLREETPEPPGRPQGGLGGALGPPHRDRIALEPVVLGVPRAALDDVQRVGVPRGGEVLAPEGAGRGRRARPACPSWPRAGRSRSPRRRAATASRRARRCARPRRRCGRSAS